MERTSNDMRSVHSDHIYDNLLSGETGYTVQERLCRKRNSANLCISGYFESGFEFENRLVAVVKYGCLGMQCPAITIEDPGPGGDQALFNRSQETGMQGCRRKVGLGFNDTFNGHYHGRICQADQRTTMHQAAALGIVEEKRHSQCCPTFSGFNNGHVQKALKRCTADPSLHLESVWTG